MNLEGISLDLKISIALACYNGQKYIKEQLLSLLNQTMPANEVIIVDDNSSDDTPEIINKFIEKYKLSNWKFYINDYNLGFIKNFHKALSKTSGDIIFLCDQDDIWKKTKIKKIHSIFQSDPQISAISTSYEFIDNYGNNVLVPNFNGVQHYELKGIKKKQIMKASTRGLR